MPMFDSITSEKLKFYVYALINPLTKGVFYIGKGKDNRVFEHKKEVIENPDQIDSSKKKEIESILNQNHEIEYLILRHGLTENEALLVESVLIDYHNYFNSNLSNEVAGHNAGFYGIKTSDDLARQYNAPPLKKLHHKVIIININKRYADTKSNLSIYEATKQAWVISEARTKKLQYALAEFQGVIIGVYRIHRWYRVKTYNNIRNNRWGFDGEEAAEAVQKLYKNKSIAHVKKKGAANPIRYSI